MAASAENSQEKELRWGKVLAYSTVEQLEHGWVEGLGGWSGHHSNLQRIALVGKVVHWLPEDVQGV